MPTLLCIEIRQITSLVMIFVHRQQIWFTAHFFYGALTARSCQLPRRGLHWIVLCMLCAKKSFAALFIDRLRLPERAKFLE